MQTLYTAATGMEAMQTKLDVIAHNLANVNTTAYKRDRANFEDLFYRHPIAPGSEDSAGGQTATGIHIGLGTRVNSVQSEFEQGAIRVTGNPLHMAIIGNGFFSLRNSDGSTVYTRAGNFEVNSQNELVLASAEAGRSLDPAIQLPEQYTSVTISPDGRVLVTTPDNPSQQTEQGRIQLTNFINPGGLKKIGENLYQETPASGTANSGDPDRDGLGSLKQGALELSNVEPVEELIDLITTQRAFELNSQAVKVGDSMLELVANLRRF